MNARESEGEKERERESERASLVGERAQEIVVGSTNVGDVSQIF